MQHEASYYQVIAKWFELEKDCRPPTTDHPLHGLGLLKGDVWAWRRGNTTETPDYVCEVKAYPFPSGAGGYGSVGQAVAFRKFAETAYVACVTAARPVNRSWSHVARPDSDVGKLLSRLGISPPSDFSQYLVAVRQFYTELFSGLGLGLLIVETPCHVVKEASDPITYAFQPGGRTPVNLWFKHRAGRELCSVQVDGARDLELKVHKILPNDHA